MYNNNLIIITKKTQFFIIFILHVVKLWVVGLKINFNIINIYINAVNKLHILNILKYNSILSMDKLIDIVVVDNLKKINRFEVTYIYWNMLYEYRFSVKLFTDIRKPIYSINNFYKCSLWLEREVWDMFGIKFIFHTGLRRILTDYGFKGHPLRKDFPLVGYIDIYYDDTKQSIKVVPLELSQALRFYKFENPWNKWYI